MNEDGIFDPDFFNFEPKTEEGALDPNYKPISELINDIRKLFRMNHCIGDIYLTCTNGRIIPLWLVRDLIGIPKTLEDVFWIRPIQ